MVFFFLISSCSIQKQPIFLKVDDVKVSSFTGDTIRVQATAFFENPNDVGGKISTDEIKVIVNGAHVAQVSSEAFKVPARKEFSVPLTVVIPANKVFKNNKNGILGGLLTSFLKKSIKVQFKGEIKYKVLGFSSVYFVDHIQEIKL